MKDRPFSEQNSIDIMIDGCCSENSLASCLRNKNQPIADADCVEMQDNAEMLIMISLV
jgi:hypothetical protein